MARIIATTGVEVAARTDTNSSATGMALLRITLGVILVRTWFQNLSDDLYTADGFEGLINWLFSPEGNDSSLGFYESILDAVVVPISGVYVIVQLVIELLIGVGLVLGGFTRLCALISAVFFFNLFLAYFGGHEWIWTYVLLFMSSVAVYLGNAGAKWGIDPQLSSQLRSSKLAKLL